MAGFLADAYINNFSSLGGKSVRLDICSAEPTTYSIATTDGTSSAGNKTGLTMGSLADGDTDGRKVVLAAITDGTVTQTVSATYWAITDGVSELIAYGQLTSPQSVTATNTFTLDAITITIRDAVEV